MCWHLRWMWWNKIFGLVDFHTFALVVWRNVKLFLAQMLMKNSPPTVRAECQGVHAGSSHPGLQELFQGRSIDSAMRWALQLKMANHSSQTLAFGIAPFSLLQSSRKAQKETDKAAQLGGLHCCCGPLGKLHGPCFLFCVSGVAHVARVAILATVCCHSQGIRKKAEVGGRRKTC